MRIPVTVYVRQELAKEWCALGRADATKYLEEAMVLTLVRSHRITASRGAELLGMRYPDFLDLLAANDVDVLDYRPGEVAKDVKVLKRWLADRPKTARQFVSPRSKPRGSPAAVLHAMRRLPHLRSGDVDALERAIERDKLPPRAEGIFDAGSRKRR